jgi:Flp pilus assembly protein TadD
MNDDLGQWQWVDEDPFEKLLRTPKGAAVNAPANPLVESLEPLRFEEAPTNNFTTSRSEPEHAAPQFNSLEDAKTLEPLAPVEAVAVNGHAQRPQQADSDLADAAGERRASAAEHFELAVSLDRQEQWGEAAKSFRRALEVEPGRAEALIGLGSCLLHLGDAEEALNCFNQGLFWDVGRKRALLGKAVALHKLTRYEDADRAYREFLQTSPDSPEPLANLIALSVARRDTAAVAEYANRLLRLDPNAKAALQGLATLALWNHDQAAAVDYCTRLVDLDPKSIEGRHNLAFAKQKMIPAERAMRSIA